MATVLQLVDYLATAERAYAAMQKEGNRLKCAVGNACVETLRYDLEQAMGQQAPTLSHGGKFYVAAVGRA